MYATALIVFREVLEIALIVGIILAATRGLPRRWLMVAGGLGLGAVGAGIIALCVDGISALFDGMGQEVLNAAILFAAVAMLGWTVVWMRRHGRELAGKLKQTGKQVMEGDRPVTVIALIIALATFREGAEIVLFLYGMLASGEYTPFVIGEGVALGVAGGVLMGAALYFGLFKLLNRHLFTVTGWMLILLTAGLAAKGMAFLVAADMVPEIAPALWDSSSFLTTDSLAGKLMEVLVGYNPQPTGIEVITYLAVIMLLGVFYSLSGRKPKTGAANTGQPPAGHTA
jgi:high-affinity iron transporter